MLQMVHDYISMLLKYGQGNEQMELAALEICPQSFPQPKDVWPVEFTFIPNKEHPEEEEKVGRVGRLKVKVESRVHELDQVIQGQ